MNETNVADTLGLDSAAREFKLGSSFTTNKIYPSEAFYSVRYDFKPASLDTSKSALVEVGNNHDVTISMSNRDGQTATVFKGACQPCSKECVLIIDDVTGEVVLEKLSNNIQVKRTRDGGSKSKTSSEFSLLPSPNPSSTGRCKTNVKSRLQKKIRAMKRNRTAPTKLSAPEKVREANCGQPHELKTIAEHNNFSQSVQLTPSSAPTLNLTQVEGEPDKNIVVVDQDQSRLNCILRNCIEQLKNKPDACKFTTPVAESDPYYYTVVKNPIFLDTMMEKATSNTYRSSDEFMSDLTLICANSEKYHGPNHLCTKQANNLVNSGKEFLKAHIT